MHITNILLLVEIEGKFRQVIVDDSRKGIMVSLAKNEDDVLQVAKEIVPIRVDERKETKNDT